MLLRLLCFLFLRSGSWTDFGLSLLRQSRGCCGSRRTAACSARPHRPVTDAVFFGSTSAPSAVKAWPWRCGVFPATAANPPACPSLSRPSKSAPPTSGATPPNATRRIKVVGGTVSTGQPLIGSPACASAEANAPRSGRVCTTECQWQRCRSTPNRCGGRFIRR